MKRKSIPRIITNRQLNFTLSPVDTHNKKEMPHRLQNYEIDGTWNHHQSIILDCILDRLFNAMYKGYNKLPRSWRSKKTIEVTDGLIDPAINPWALTVLNKSLYDAYIVHSGYDVFGKIKAEFRKSRRESTLTKGLNNFKQYLNYYYSTKVSKYRDFKNEINNLRNIFYCDFEVNCCINDLLEGYPFLKRYKYSLAEQLKRIESTKFRMNYKVKYIEKIPVWGEDRKMTERGKLVDMYYEMMHFQHIFKVTFEDDIITFNFNTPLGKLIIYNMLILDTDWIPVAACNLSKNAYFLYKRANFKMFKNNH